MTKYEREKRREEERRRGSSWPRNRGVLEQWKCDKRVLMGRAVGILPMPLCGTNHYGIYVEHIQALLVCCLVRRASSSSSAFRHLADHQIYSSCRPVPPSSCISIPHANTNSSRRHVAQPNRLRRQAIRRRCESQLYIRQKGPLGEIVSPSATVSQCQGLDEIANSRTRFPIV